MPNRETATQKKRRLAKAQLKRRQKIADESFVQKQTRLEIRRATRAEKLLNEPLADRFFRQYIDKIRAQDRRSSETPYERAARIEKCRIHAQLKKRKSEVCNFCRKRFYPHEVTKYNRVPPPIPLLQELRNDKEEFVLCYQCKAIVNHQPAKSFSQDLPSCSSLADSDHLAMEDDAEPEPLSLLEVKEEVLWEEPNCSREEEWTQKEAQEYMKETQQGGALQHMGVENRVGWGQTRQENQVIATLEEIRGEISALARADALAEGLERIREEMSALARGDEFEAFGRYVASLLRNMHPRRAQQAQPLIINLLAAEMIKKEEDET